MSECECYPVHYGPQCAASKFGHTPYVQKLIDSSPLVYFPLNEASGTTATNWGSLSTAANGTSHGVTWAGAAGPDDVNTAPLFDGAASYIDIMTDALVDAWDAGGDEWSIMVWWKVYNAAVWPDANNRYVLRAFDTGANYVDIFKGGANQFYHGLWIGGGVTESHSTVGTVPTAWANTVITRSESADEIRYYYAGAWLATDTTIGVWASATPWDRIVVGASSLVPAFSWYGWIAHLAAWDRVLGATEILSLATV